MPTLQVVEVAEAQKTDKFCRTVLSDPRTIHGRDHLFFVDDDILCHRHRHLDSTITQIVMLYQPARARSRYLPISRIFLLIQVDQARR